MTSDAVRVVNERPGSVLSKVSGHTAGPQGSLQDPDAHFREEWTRLTEQVRSCRKAVDVDERIHGEHFDRALDLALQYPDRVEVTSKPVDEVMDIREHVQGHFDVAFNNDEFAPRHSVPRASNFRTLIRACELVYLDDAVLRFVPRWRFDPALDDLEPLEINDLTPQLGQWMEKVQLMWDAFGGLVELPQTQ